MKPYQFRFLCALLLIIIERTTFTPWMQWLIGGIATLFVIAAITAAAPPRPKMP